MEIDNLHINQKDFDLFQHLQPKDKIEFLYDAQSLGLDIAVSKITTDTPIQKSKQTLNDIFQDTVYEELTWDDDNMNILILNKTIHINSSSISWVKRIILKLWMDGHILIRNKIAKKIPGIDKQRYYRCYDIIGTVPPICLS